MRNHLLAVPLLLLGAGTGGAFAQAAVDAELRAARDSDSFEERVQTLQWTSPGGLGLKAGAMQYSAPGWRRSGRQVAGTWRHRSEGSRLDLSVGVAEVGDFRHGVAALDYLRQVAEGSSLGLSAERSYVDSVGGIEQGLRFNHLAVVGDHRFGPRLDLGLAAGATRFSDDNTRRLLRTRWNLALHEGSGLHLFLKTRSHWNSNPYRPAYFSPERLHEVSLGLSSRIALADVLVLSAQADAGRQRTEFSSQPLWSYSLGLSSPRSSRVVWRIALQGSNAASSSSAGGGDGYRRTALTASLSVPF